MITDELSCIFQYGVGAALVVIGSDVNIMIWLYAKLGTLAVVVIHGASRKTYTPSAGERTGKGQSSASSCLVADDYGLACGAHVFDKFVCCTVYLSVGEHHHGLVPSEVGGWLEPLLLHL